MKVKKILASVFPKIKPIADSRWWSNTNHQWLDVGKIIMWEVSWLQQDWYVYKGYSFPYPEFEKVVTIKRIGQYWYWKGY